MDDSIKVSVIKVKSDMLYFKKVSPGLFRFFIYFICTPGVAAFAYVLKLNDVAFNVLVYLWISLLALFGYLNNKKNLKHFENSFVEISFNKVIRLYKEEVVLVYDNINDLMLTDLRQEGMFNLEVVSNKSSEVFTIRLTTEEYKGIKGILRKRSVNLK